MHIAIVEDNLALLENLRLMLQGEPGCVVTGGWQSAEEALAAPVWADTNILLADLDLPGMSGVDLISQLKSRYPALNCMAYTIYEDRSTVFSAIKAGACGYLLEGSTPRELIEALRDLHEGGAPMSPKVARKVIYHFQEITGGGPPDDGLTSREQDVLRRLEQGQSYKEIGVAMGISAHTVHTHIKHIYEKLQGRTRAEVMRKARQRGWL
jgi:DNA-binding NarL/FixJ family response regulator